MGFFDFLFGKKRANRDRGGQQANADGRLEGPSPSYVFTYYMLSSVALSDPESLIEIAAHPAGIRGLLAAILDDAATYCRAPAPFSADSIRVHCDIIGNSQSVVFELPEPQEVPEAYLVALVVTDGKGRYFSVERSFSSAHAHCAVLGEWDARGHLNHGRCEPTVAGFKAALSRLV
ncbi:MAG: hypothetical protein ACKOEO_17125 [Planctomycetaceae bacterium]